MSKLNCWRSTILACMPVAMLFSGLAGSQVLAQEDTRSEDGNEARIQTAADNINRFIRVRRDREKNPVGMETSITRYIGTNSDGEQIIVDLIGVVHIGEREYYEQLNKQFTQYDALLYELVAPEGTVIPRGGGERGFNPISGLQQGMQAMLGLEFQLEHIDYTMENFVHADMTPEEFAESMERNEESFFKMALKAIGQSMAMQSRNDSSDIEMVFAMLNGDVVKVRQFMAEQMMDLESGMIIFQGKDGSTIIDHRNAKAFQIMVEQIEAGKKHIGVFYGAGHLPDMDERLLKDHGMKRAGQNWLRAWSLQDE